MNGENKLLAEVLRKEFQRERTSHLVKIESERKLAEKLGVGRQRIREVIGQLVSEGLLIKHEGKGTYIAPLIKSNFLNLICSPNIKNNDPFYNSLLMELTSYAAKNNVNLISLRMDTLRYGRPKYPLLLIGRFEEEYLLKLKQSYSKIISFENYPEHDELTQIYFDHFKIGMNAAKVLAEYGHKKVIHITGPARYASAYFRKNGFIRGARKYGLEYSILEGKMNFEGGNELGSDVADLVKKRNYTAIFSANDWMAIGLIQALKSKNIDVPKDVSTLSVDNIPLASQIAPNLTTYSLDAGMMVAECFSLIEAVYADDEQANFQKRIILQPVLITRDTLKNMNQ